MTGSTRTPVSFLPALVSILLGAVYMVFFLAGESQLEIFGLLLGACLVLLLLRRFKILERVGRSAKDHSMAFGAAAVAATVAISLYFYDDNFVLFLVATVLVYTLTCLGLNIQFGFVGVVNFAGASFFGVGCYTAAILTKHTATPHLLVLLLGGLAAAALGFIVLVPVLKTRGHYSALVTIAFALLFKTFLEVNDTLGGPRGSSATASISSAGTLTRTSSSAPSRALFTWATSRWPWPCACWVSSWPGAWKTPGWA